LHLALSFVTVLGLRGDGCSYAKPPTPTLTDDLPTVCALFNGLNQTFCTANERDIKAPLLLASSCVSSRVSELGHRSGIATASWSACTAR
jgi:hypothetical protein